MKKSLLEYKKLFRDKKYKNSLKIGFILLLLAGITNLLVFRYLKTVVGTSVGDLILDNLPTLGLFWFRTFGIALIIIWAVFLIFSKPKYLPISLKLFGVMYIIRPLFVILTHLKAYPEKILISTNQSFFGKLFIYQADDLFFSGHVAFPFMISLIFWDNKKIRYSFITITIISGMAALLAKTHYSIDVFAAPFIIYSIFKVSEILFKKDFARIK